VWDYLNIPIALEGEGAETKGDTGNK